MLFGRWYASPRESGSVGEGVGHHAYRHGNLVIAYWGYE